MQTSDAQLPILPDQRLLISAEPVSPSFCSRVADMPPPHVHAMQSLMVITCYVSNVTCMHRWLRASPVLA